MSELINFIKKNKEAIIKETKDYMNVYAYNCGTIMLVDKPWAYEQCSEIEFKFYPLSIKTEVDPLGQYEVESINYRIDIIKYKKLINECDFVDINLTEKEEEFICSFLVENENELLYPYIPEHQF